MNKIGIIDLGTNTFNLLIAEVDGIDHKVIHKNKIAVKLGEGGITKGFIADRAFQRGLKALENHRNTLKMHQVDECYAIATSAIRSASNGTQFTEIVKSSLNLHINIIDGLEEAELIFAGVKQAIDLKDSPKLIIDIGGGSTEFIIANEAEVFWKKSYKLGAARLLEMFEPSDPITLEEVDRIELHLEQELKELIEMVRAYEVDCLIGSSGSFDTLAEMISCKNGNCEDWKNKNYFHFNMHDYNFIPSMRG